jgi:CRP-like cAMP-binding protein
MSSNESAADKNIKVFVVTGETSMLEVTRGALVFMGYNDVSTLVSTDNALGNLVKRGAGMIISDADTLTAGSPSLLSSIKNHPKLVAARIVLLHKGDIGAASLKQLYREGICSLLKYPFHMNDLQKAIDDAVRNVPIAISDTFGKVRKLDFFSFMDDEEIIKLLKISKYRMYRKGDIIFDEADIGDRFYVIIDGVVDIVQDQDQGQGRIREEVLASLTEGACFGEMALLDNSPRSARARAGQNVLLFELDNRVMEGYDDLLTLKLFKKLAFIFTERLRVADTKIKDLALYVHLND